MKKLIKTAVTACTALTLLPFTAIAAEGENTTGSVTILFTEDLHDQLESIRSKNDEGDVKWFGGMAALKYTIDSCRTDNTLLLDAGDFSTGSIYDVLFESDAPALQLMQELGYDAIALGEGEFRYGPGALGSMISTPADTPVLLASNLTVKNSGLKSAWEEKGNTTAVFEMNGIHVGVFSLLSEDAAKDDVGNYEVTSPEETAKNCVDSLKEEGADVIVCLSHCNTDLDPEADQRIAEKVDGIDVMISGHTDSKTDEVLQAGDTAVVYTGKNGKYLGVLEVSADGEVLEYRTEHTEWYKGNDSGMSARVSSYASSVNSGFLNGTGYTTGSPVAKTLFSFTAPEEAEFGQMNTADLIAEAYEEFYKEHRALLKEEERRKAIEEAERAAARAEEEAEAAGETDEEETEEEEEEEHVSTFSKEGILLLLEEAKQSWIEILNGGLENRDPEIAENPIALIGAEEINDTFYAGNITVSDVFRVLSSDTTGDNGIDGALITAYISGKDLRNLCELDLILGRQSSSQQMYFGNLRYEYNDKRSDYNKVTSVTYRATTEYYVTVRKDMYYPVVMTLDQAKRIQKMAADAPEGMTVTFCNEKGKKAVSPSMLVMNESGVNISDTDAVLRYLDGIGRQGIVGTVESEFKTANVTKTENTTLELKALFKNTSAVGWNIYKDYAIKGFAGFAVLAVINAILRRTSLKKRH